MYLKNNKICVFMVVVFGRIWYNLLHFGFFFNFWMLLLTCILTLWHFFSRFFQIAPHPWSLIIVLLIFLVDYHVFNNHLINKVQSFNCHFFAFFDYSYIFGYAIFPLLSFLCWIDYWNHSSCSFHLEYLLDHGSHNGVHIFVFKRYILQLFRYKW